MEHLHGSSMLPELNKEVHRTLINFTSMERSEMEEVNSGMVAMIYKLLQRIRRDLNVIC